MNSLRSLSLLSIVALGAIVGPACASDEGAQGTAGKGSGATDGGLDGASGSSGAGTGGSATGGSSATASGGSATGGSGGSATGGAGGFIYDGNLDVTFGYDVSQPDAYNFDAACAKAVVQAQPTPLDMYVMMDISGSMLETTTAGPTKWQAIKDAMIGFLDSPGSAGIGVGIQYFPLNIACTSDAQCGTSGPCILKGCANKTTLVPCSSNSDCGNGAAAQCVTLGICSLNSSTYCSPIGANIGAGCGLCNALTTSTCFHPDCTVADYQTPAVEIALLPGNRNPLVNSMNAQVPNGQTPTGPALQGAINHAKSWAQQNPTHTVVTVLATDGIPNECTPTLASQIATIANVGLVGTPSIKTFVIGVFVKTDTGALSNLNTIATGGGTGSAFIVDPSTDVTSQFLAALSAIQGKSIGCEFLMPTSSDAGVVDPTKILLEYTATSGISEGVPRTTDATTCTGDAFYFDNNTSPTKVQLCPSLCTKVQTDPGATVNVLVGCAGS